MKLKCPECGAPISDENVNLKAGLASCRSCDRMFVVTRRGEELVPAPADKASPKPQPTSPSSEAPPCSFTVDEHDGSLTITFPPCGFGQGWRYLSVAAFALVFAVVLFHHVVVFRPLAFPMFLAGAVLIGLIAVAVVVAGLHVSFGVGKVVLARAEGVFTRRLLGLTWTERAPLDASTRVEPFRARQRARIELFTCGLVIAGKRHKLFRELGDAEMFRLAELVNGFLKRVHAEDFSSLQDRDRELGQ
ncbi:MAG: hypothetical protein JW889_00825 [Verrucomicrobia bacterium]|nr:hypothetical protein [Verrucomicrobiota bacterium]